MDKKICQSYMKKKLKVNMTREKVQHHMKTQQIYKKTVAAIKQCR